MSETIVLAVTADVMFYDGSQWVRPDITNGLHSVQNSQYLSDIQLVRNNQDLVFSIIAIRNRDNKRLINQPIFQRFKYKEATSSFHQWRNEHKQVIGLNFPNEHDAKRFYLAVREVLDNTMHFQQQQSPLKPFQQPELLYQDPHNCQNSHFAKETCSGKLQQQHQLNYDDALRTTSNRNVPSQNSMHQQGLLRRASQSSNISSSTGGSGQGHQIYALTANQSNGDDTRRTYDYCVANGSNTQQQIGQPLNCDALTMVAAGQQHRTIQTGHSAPPPPPPPPPPDLKNFLISGKKQSSFADQLKHVKLRKSSDGNEHCVATSNGSTTSALKPQIGNQDLMNELSDRLNKRKMNVDSSSGNNSHCQNRTPAQSLLVTNNLKNIVNAVAASHKKIPSGSSLSSQDDVNNAAGNVAGDTISVGEQQQTMAGSTIDLGSKDNKTTVVTPGDLERMKAELIEEFGRELNRIKHELVQTIRDEIAKLITASK